MNNKEKYLAARMKCERRVPISGKPVEQAVRSCMHAYWIANHAKLLSMNGSEGITGLPFKAALEKCRKCPIGKKLMDDYEKKFGKCDLFKRENMAKQAHKIRVNKYAYNSALPWTKPAILVDNGYPADF